MFFISGSVLEAKNDGEFQKKNELGVWKKSDVWLSKVNHMPLFSLSSKDVTMKSVYSTSRFKILNSIIIMIMILGSYPEYLVKSFTEPTKFLLFVCVFKWDPHQNLLRFRHQDFTSKRNMCMNDCSEYSEIKSERKKILPKKKHVIGWATYTMCVKNSKNQQKAAAF